MELKYHKILSAFLFVVVLFLIVFVGYIIIKNEHTTLRYEQMKLNCCGGNDCSDTYYTEEDNLCHLVLCENFILMNKSECVYEGKGILINNTIMGTI